MQKYIIHGGKPLSGDIRISGMKNAALPILFATILASGKSVLHNIPDVSDVHAAIEILRSVGAEVIYRPDGIEICTDSVSPGIAPYELVQKIRASTYLMGAELGRFHTTRVAMPGGCDFGQRPIDLHIKGFESLGATIQLAGGYVCGEAPNGLFGSEIYFDTISVGATVNLILASVLSDGITVLYNAAREPHICDLANFLNACGARITGAGTSVIKIKGVDKLHGVDYTVIPDMIEAGTYMVAAAATKGRLTLTDIIPKHMDSVTAKLIQAGAVVEEGINSLTVSSGESIRGIQIKTLPYPGFPTDMHPQFSVLLSLSDETSTITEGIWENRFRYADELCRMGANITVNGKTATIKGQGGLCGVPVKAVDLRAGAALVVAGLAAEGRTEISDVGKICRGYDHLVEKLRDVGADITLVET